MSENILNSWKFKKEMEDIDRKELKRLKKYRNNFYAIDNLFNVNDFEIGDIIYCVEKYEDKSHNKVSPCKIMSKVKTTTRNCYKFVEIKQLNVKSKNGKENKIRLYLLDYNIDINENSFHMVFTNKEVAQAYSEDYEPKFNRIYQIDKKRLKKSYQQMLVKSKLHRNGITSN